VVLQGDGIGTDYLLMFEISFKGTFLMIPIRLRKKKFDRDFVRTVIGVGRGILREAQFPVAVMKGRLEVVWGGFVKVWRVFEETLRNAYLEANSGPGGSGKWFLFSG
jgi:hypothetical protein